MRTKMTPEEIRIERLDTFVRMLRKVDRTLTGREIHCQRVDGALPNRTALFSPAASNGNTIYFNSRTVGDLSSPEEVIVLNGLNYHELCHILYTPRSEGVFRQLQLDGYGTAFNALEDQRIESMFVSLYPGTKPYFTMTVMQHILNDAKNVEKSFPLTWGRRFLGGEIRNNLAALYPNQQIVQEVKDIIDEYRTLVFPQDKVRCCELATRYGNLLGIRHTDSQASDPYAHDANVSRHNGRPEGAREQKNVQEWREEDDAAQEEEDQQSDTSDGAEEAGADGTEEGDTEDGGNEGTEEGDNEDGDAEGTEEGKDGEDTEEGDAGEDGEDGDDSDGSDESTAQQGQGDLDDGRTGDKDRDTEDQKSDSGSGSGDNSVGGGASRGGNVTTPSEVQDKMREVVKELMDDPEVQAEAKDKLRVLQRGDNDTTAPFDTYPSKESPVTPQMRNVSKKITNQFQRLVRDLDPGFHTHRSTGRVNMGRAMRGDDIDTVFDQWDEGKFDASDIEIVVMVDLSGSMGPTADATSQALWVIMDGVRSIGNTVRAQALGFETAMWNLYRPNEGHSKVMYSTFAPRGGTNVHEGLSHARSVFRKSQKAHKILLTISDGQWVDAADADPIMENLTEAGVLTGAFHLDPNDSIGKAEEYYTANGRPDEMEKYRNKLRHHAKFFHIGKEITDMIPLVTTMVKHAMQG